MPDRQARPRGTTACDGTLHQPPATASGVIGGMTQFIPLFNQALSLLQKFDPNTFAGRLNRPSVVKLQIKTRLYDGRPNAFYVERNAAATKGHHDATPVPPFSRPSATRLPPGRFGGQSHVEQARRRPAAVRRLSANRLKRCLISLANSRYSRRRRDDGCSLQLPMLQTPDSLSSYQAACPVKPATNWSKGTG